MFDNYTYELEYSLKEQYRFDRASWTAPFGTNIAEIKSRNKPRSKLLRVPVKHQKEISATEKAHQIILHEKTHGKIEWVSEL